MKLTDITKTEDEMGYWQKCYANEGNKLYNAHYQDLITAVVNKPTEWFDDKIICDFGCGPRGSLEWANNARERYCADVLVDEYRALGIDAHKAIYIKTTEDTIPLPSESCDVTLTINSIDHVDNLDLMCGELLRVTKVGGYVGGSVNLNEPWTPAEPNTITEKTFTELVLSKLDVERYIIAPNKTERLEGESNYQYLFDHVRKGTPLPQLPEGDIGYLWFLGRKV